MELIKKYTLRKEFKERLKRIDEQIKQIFNIMYRNMIRKKFTRT